ncbi:MAG: ribosomal protein L7/L12 [Chitinophagaceae bacterium]
MTFYEYFQSYENYFWQWEEHVEVLGIPNENTIAYRAWMIDVLQKIAPQGLPPFGTLLLATIATNPNGEKSLDAVYSILNQHLDSTNNSYLIDAIPFLKMLSSISKEYKTGNKRIQLFQVIFERCHYAASIKDSKAILDVYISNKFGEGIISSNKKFEELVYKRDFKPLCVLNKWFKKPNDIIEKIAGLPEIPDEILEIENKTEDDSKPKSFIDEMLDNAKTFHIGALIKRIWSGLNIPFHSELQSQQPIGGVSDLTNNGDFDKLLISEFANDDIVFLSRLANNEALYIRREIPPTNNHIQRNILIDVSLKNWGTPKTIAYAIMLAIAKHPKTNIECLAFAVGETFHPISIQSIDTIIDALQILEGSLNAANGLNLFFKEYPQSKNREVFIITENSTIKQSAMLKTIADFHSLVNYWVYTTAEGHINIYKKQQSSKKHIQHILLPLKELWANPKKEALQHKRKSDDTALPILFRSQTNVKKILSTSDGEIFQISGDKKLFRFFEKSCKANEKGWELIYEDLPYVGGQFEMGLMDNGEYILLMFHIQKKEIILLNINTKEISRFPFLEWKSSEHSEFIFYKNEFHYLDRHANWSFNFAEFGIKKGQIDLLDIYSERQKEHQKNQFKFKERYPILKHVNSIFINQANNLVFNQQELLINNGDHIKLEQSNFLTSSFTARKSSESEFVFADGSSIEINKCGLFILKSSNLDIPTIYIPSALQASLGAVAENYFAGNEYFYKEQRFDIILDDAGINKLNVTRAIHSELQIPLNVAKNLVDNCPSVLKQSYVSHSAFFLKSELEKSGAKIKVKESSLWTSNKYRYNKISTQEFFKKHIQAFIKTIQNYGINH